MVDYQCPNKSENHAESDRCYKGKMDTNVHVCTRVYVSTGKTAYLTVIFSGRKKNCLNTFWLDSRRNSAAAIWFLSVECSVTHELNEVFQNTPCLMAIGPTLVKVVFCDYSK